jgi:RNA polymerase sigma-70 factor (ECF subfamily)
MGLTVVGDDPAGTDPAIELTARVRRGDTGAEDELCRRFERGLLRILQRATGDRELARELCQETLLIVLKRVRSGSLEDPARLAAFAAQTARNLAIAEHRKAQRRGTQTGSHEIDQWPDPHPSQAEIEEANSAAAAVRKLLAELRSERDRTVLIRYYLNDEDKETICNDLHLTAIVFHQVLVRARNRLRALLGKHGLADRDLLSVCLA